MEYIRIRIFTLRSLPLMRLVVPGMLMGTPAMMTTRSPDFTIPIFLGSFSISPTYHQYPSSWRQEQINSHDRLSLLTVERWRLSARIGCLGRSLETHRAVLPDSVGVMMAMAPLPRLRRSGMANRMGRSVSPIDSPLINRSMEIVLLRPAQSSPSSERPPQEIVH